MAQDDEFAEMLEKLQSRNRELLEAEATLQSENLYYKQKYNELVASTERVGHILERNAKIFIELLDDAKSAVQLCRVPSYGALGGCRNSTTILDAIGSRNSSYVASVSVQRPKVVPNAVAGCSNGRREEVRAVRQKITIKPINLNDVREAIEVEPTHEETLNSFQSCIENERLSTILEERSSSSLGKTPIVKLTRLSADVMEKYLKKRDDSLDMTVSFNKEIHPSRASTPCKMERMRLIGLIPSSQFERSQLESPKDDFISLPTKSTNFVSMRRRHNVKLSPKKEQESPKPSRTPPSTKKKLQSPEAPEIRTPELKKRKAEPIKRPSRKAKPTSLKEEPLNLKLRRQ